MEKGLLLQKVKQHVSRQMIVGGVLLITTLMIFNVGGLGSLNFDGFIAHANNDTAQLNVVIAAGSMQILNATDVLFSSGTSGTASTETGVMNNITISDYRASPDQWTIWGNSALLNATGALNIPAVNVQIYPGNADIINTETFDPAAVIPNSTTNLTTNVALFNSGYNDSGIVTMTNIDMDMTVNASLDAGTYNGEMKVTVVVE